MGLSFNVTIQPDEQLEGVTVDIGRDAAKALAVEWVPERQDARREEGATHAVHGVPLRLAAWSLPAFHDYHGYYEAWFEVDQAHQHLVQGTGTLFVCDNTGGTSVKWISALVVKK
jgi:hypothetical protein